MKQLVIVAALALTACSTVVPVKQEFPVAPSVLLEKCPNLIQMDEDKNSIKEMLKVVIQNYTLYYECSTKVEGWNEWYEEQKKIQDNVK